MNGSASTPPPSWSDGQNSTVEQEPLIPISGSYELYDVFIDLILFVAVIVCAALALRVMRKSHQGAWNLLSKFVVVEIVTSISLSVMVLVRALPSYFGISADLRQSSASVRIFAGLFTSFSLTLILNILLLTALRCISVVRPFFYERNIAYNQRIMHVAVPLMVLGVISETAAMAANQSLLLRIYSNVPLLDLTSPNNFIPLVGHSTVFILVLIAILILDITIWTVSRRLERRTPTVVWDQTMTTDCSSRDSELAAELTPSTPPAAADRLKVVYRSISTQPNSSRRASESANVVYTKYINGGGVVTPFPARQRRHSDSDIPSCSHTGGTSADGELLESPPLAQRTHKALFLSQSLSDIRSKSHGSSRKKRHRDSARWRLLHHRFTASPVTKLVLITSSVHLISNIPVVCIVGYTWATKEVLGNSMLWCMRLWTIPMIANSFIYVLARRTHQQEVKRLFAPVRKCLRRLRSCFRGR